MTTPQSPRPLHSGNAQARPGAPPPEPQAPRLSSPLNRAILALKVGFERLLAAPAELGAIEQVSAALRHLGSLGPACLPELTRRAEQVAICAAGPRPRFPEGTADVLEAPLAEAFARAAARSPRDLLGRYQNAASAYMRNVVCEAAGELGRARPHASLLAVMRQHLECNPGHAALVLEAYGDLACIPDLERALGRTAKSRRSQDLAATFQLRDAIDTLASKRAGSAQSGGDHCRPPQAPTPRPHHGLPHEPLQRALPAPRASSQKAPSPSLAMRCCDPSVDGTSQHFRSQKPSP